MQHIDNNRDFMSCSFSIYDKNGTGSVIGGLLTEDAVNTGQLATLDHFLRRN